MNDEQTIYISPEDDLTTLRERLEQIPSHKITLVIPNQTQLRSHVAWKLLYARARELGKEVLIVSSDPRIRSVAHAVKFKVVHSLETHTSSQRIRTGRHGGSDAGHRDIDSHRSHSNMPLSVMGTQSTTTRGSRRRQDNPHSPGASLSLPQGPSLPPSRSEPSRPSALSGAMGSRPPFVNDPVTRLSEKPLSLGIRQSERLEWEELEIPNKPYTTKNPESYEFRIEQIPYIQPLSIHSVEDPDLLLEDYTQAQSILQAASRPTVQEDKDELAIEPNKILPLLPSDSQPAIQQFGDDDPFIHTQDDLQLPPRPQQEGETIVEEFDSLPEYPQSSQGAAFDLDTRLGRDLTEQFNDNDEDSISPISSMPSKQERRREEHLESLAKNQTKQASRLQELRLSTSYTEMQIPSQSQFDVGDDNPLTLPEQVEPLRMSRPLSLLQRRVGSKSLIMRVKQQSSRLLAQKSQSKTATQINGRPSLFSVLRPISQKHISICPKSIRQRIQSTNKFSQGSRRWTLMACIVALLIVLSLATVSVIYLNISSTVKICVVTQNYTQRLPFTLSSPKLPHTVPARQISQMFTETIQEPATGSTTKGTNAATGVVYFTNSGDVQVQIPSQLILKTTDDIEFVTTVNAIILPQADTTVRIPISVQAKFIGTDGNVLANSITVIPPGSFAAIAQDQNTITVEDLKQHLTVTNPIETTGGEASQVVAVGQEDLDSAKKNLRQLAQEDINRWLQPYREEGIVGQPTTTDTLINPPSVGTAQPDKTFLATISIKVTVLVADRADIKKEALRALNVAIQADQRFGPKFAILGDFQTIEIAQVQPSGDNANMIKLDVTGQAGPNLDIPALQKEISGKSLDQAKAILRRERPQDINIIDIQTQPNMLGGVSPWANHINVIVQPVAKPS